jgi:hypothetical protein
MEPPNAKYRNILMVILMFAALILKSVIMLLACLLLWTLLKLYPSSKFNPMKVKKVKYNSETENFQLLMENTSAIPLSVSYAIRSVTPAVTEAKSTSEGGMEFMQGSSYTTNANYLLLSEDAPKNPVENGRLTLLESKKAFMEGMWIPQLQNTVQVTLSYMDEKTKQARTVTVKTPLEISGTHPYLRRVGVEREFILMNEDGSVAGTARSLRELAQQANDNPQAFIHHFTGGHIKKWIKDVVGDEQLCDSLKDLENEPKETLPEKFIELSSRRIVELNHTPFSGQNPLLSDVEESHAFQLKNDESYVAAVCTSLPMLLDAVKSAQTSSVAFHLARGNDYANWIGSVIGDRELSEKLGEINPANTEDAKAQIMELLSQRIRGLGG